MIEQLPMALREMAEWGLHLFPAHSIVESHCSCGDEKCASPGKHPQVKNWKDISTTDAEQIARWIVRYPGCNWGCATGMKSGLIVVDIDPRHGGDHALAQLEIRHGPIITWQSLTGGGGCHLWFRHPGLGEIRNSVSVVGNGIDIRGDGGFVVVPPSGHASGRSYSWDVDHHPDHEALADLPKWVIEVIDRPHIAAPSAPPRDWVQFVIAEVPEGSRNDRLAKLAGHLLRRRVDPRVVLELLSGWNKTKCKPPLDDAELIETIRNIAHRELLRRQEEDHAAA